MEIMALISGLLDGSLDIDEISAKAAEAAPPPNLQGMEGTIDEDSPQMTGEPGPQSGDPMKDLMEMMQQGGAMQESSAPPMIDPGAFSVRGGAVGGAPQTQATLAAVPQMAPATDPNAGLMANLQRAFK